MQIYDTITPEGSTDLLFEQCTDRRQVCNSLIDLFRTRGFDEVMTPTLEFFDVFSSSAQYFSQESMYKLMDNTGRIMVLRPDCTIPIARVVATRLRNETLPLRLYYNQQVYRTNPHLRGQSNEILQAGVELIGSNSYQSDLEILEMGATGVGQLCGDNLRLEICHIGFFKALMDALDAPDSDKEIIRRLVEEKNYAALNDVLDAFSGQKAVEALRYLPRLFGDETVFDTAAKLFPDENAWKILAYLKRLYKNLGKLGLSGKIMVDLGLVNQADYYTGVIFRGYLHGLGTPVLSGGRYDRLIGVNTEALPATGFAIDVDLLTKYRTQNNQSHKRNTPQVLVFSIDSDCVNGMRHLQTLSKEGKVCAISVFYTVEETIAYAKKIGAKEVHVVNGSVEVITVQ